jgi:copper chaperone CopZ
MSCSHCENVIKKAVSGIKGVTGVAVDLAGKTVTVTHEINISVDTIKNEIEEQGYDVIN